MLLLLFSCQNDQKIYLTPTLTPNRKMNTTRVRWLFFNIQASVILRFGEENSFSNGAFLSQSFTRELRSIGTRYVSRLSRTPTGMIASLSHSVRRAIYRSFRPIHSSICRVNTLRKRRRQVVRSLAFRALTQRALSARCETEISRVSSYFSFFFLSLFTSHSFSSRYIYTRGSHVFLVVLARSSKVLPDD